MDNPYRERLAQNHALLKSNFGMAEPPTPQEEGAAQPPLAKPPMQAASVSLPKWQSAPLATENFTDVLQARRSRRAFAQQEVSLSQLSYLLYSTQGVQKVVGTGGQSTQRCVPSGGARHAFETYLVANRVEGLAPAVYHYLPFEHRLEPLREVDYQTELSVALSGQTWAGLANALLVWAAVPARCEWRYGLRAARLMALDAGHIAQNASLSAAALGLCGCCIGAFGQAETDAMLGLDGEAEFAVYAYAFGVPK